MYTKYAKTLGLDSLFFHPSTSMLSPLLSLSPSPSSSLPSPLPLTHPLPPSPHSRPGSSAVAPPGTGARRILSDVPSHIQQLLEQQERQVLERASPSRRPYRKIVIGGGGPPGADGTVSLKGFCIGVAIETSPHTGPQLFM